MYVLMRWAQIFTVLLAVYSLIVFALVVPYGWALPAAVVVATVTRKSIRLSAFGTARWATRQDIPHLLRGNGVIVGTITGKVTKREGIAAPFDRHLDAKTASTKFVTAFLKKQPEPLVRLTTAVHTACFAPVGAGKSSSIVIPHLLRCPDSMVVVDFKGELTRATAEYRRKHFWHQISVLDPFKVVGGGDTFNPLDFIDDDRDAIDACRDLANALVTRTGQEKEPHWNDSAEVWITAMMSAAICFATPGEKNLQSVRGLLTDPNWMKNAIQAMCGSDRWEGMLSRLGHQLTQFADKELASTLTTTNRHLRFLDTPAISDSTKKSSFDPSQLARGRMTVYLVLPPEHMRSQSALLRMWIGSLLKAVVKGGLQDKRKVHFVIDEAASVGKMDCLDDAIDKYRGYGVRLLLMYQSLGQLKKCWGEDGGDHTLLSNTTQVFFGTNDQQTAEYVSNRLGEHTQIVTSGGTNTGRSVTYTSSPQGGSSSVGYSSGTNSGWQQQGRRLLRPEEVAGLDERIAITFTPGTRPIASLLVRHYEKAFATAGKGISLARLVCDTVGWFLIAAFFAVALTAVLLDGGFRWEGFNEQGQQGIFRAGEGGAFPGGAGGAVPQGDRRGHLGRPETGLRPRPK